MLHERNIFSSKPCFLISGPKRLRFPLRCILRKGIVSVFNRRRPLREISKKKKDFGRNEKSYFSAEQHAVCRGVRGWAGFEENGLINFIETKAYVSVLEEFHDDFSSIVCSSVPLPCLNTVHILYVRVYSLKGPKCENFDLFDFNDFYVIKTL